MASLPCSSSSPNPLVKKEELILAKEVCNDEDNQNIGYCTPSPKRQIPEVVHCPPALKKPKLCKRSKFIWAVTKHHILFIWAMTKIFLSHCVFFSGDDNQSVPFQKINFLALRGAPRHSSCAQLGFLRRRRAVKYHRNSALR